MSEVYKETVKRLWISNERNVYLEIAPDADTGTALEIRTTNKESVAWFGEVRLVLSKELATKLATSLIELVEKV